MEDLIRKEVVQTLKGVFHHLRLSTSTSVTREEVHQAADLFMVLYVLPGNFSAVDANDAIQKTRKLTQEYRGWPQTESWIRNVESQHLQSRATVDFETTTRFVQDLVMRYGSLNDKECRDLKKTFMSMQRVPGRVRLSDFYRKGMDSHWEFNEKREYLRALGALDESNSSSPLVIGPNYIASRSNCLETGDMYSVCCRNECEDLLGHLEMKVAAPSATPHQLVQLVSGLGSDTISAPRRLAPDLIDRLNSIASVHSGKVSLHGRLFAQWMHHAFPNECPFPHEAGTASPLTPDEWMSADVSASLEQRQRVIDEDSCSAPSADASVADLPWSTAEELLAARTFAAPVSVEDASPAWSKARVCWIILVLAVSAFGGASEQSAPLRLRAFSWAAKQGYPWQLVVVGALTLVAFAINLINRALFVFAVCGGVVSFLMAKQKPMKQKVDKCLV
jgi:hypothetical protein